MDKNKNYLKWTQVERNLKRKRIKLFFLEDFYSFFGVSPATAQKFLSRQVKRGTLLRLKREVYTLAENPPPEFLVANKIYQPSYLSLETALSFYGVMPEAVYSLISITTKPTRRFTVLGKEFLYKSLKNKAFFGYRVESILGEEIFIATPEKALADYFYFTAREGRQVNPRLDLTKVSLEKTKAALSKMGFDKPKISQFL